MKQVVPDPTTEGTSSSHRKYNTAGIEDKLWDMVLTDFCNSTKVLCTIWSDNIVCLHFTKYFGTGKEKKTVHNKNSIF